MSARLLLELGLLDGVKQVASGRYMARCPAHEDKSPSLSIRELDDGRVLIHCFGGCGTDEVLSAIGLTVADLFPERIPDARPVRPNHWHARKVAFEVIHKESLIVAIAGETLAAGTPLSLEDRNRLCLAAQRVRAAVDVCK